ncbi:MAG: hypothetical protein CBARDCOR_6776 [uncultured Caballeronia sp.]|nr:MAG: hypothetical protein CBARDCOR_6776 [uncultured Caballeronia sp.]
MHRSRVSRLCSKLVEDVPLDDVNPSWDNVAALAADPVSAEMDMHCSEWLA